eukprot:scaffold59465_cov63-Phaeocystis_antarctica.AAC.2
MAHTSSPHQHRLEARAALSLRVLHSVPCGQRVDLALISRRRRPQRLAVLRVLLAQGSHLRPHRRPDLSGAVLSILLELTLDHALRGLIPIIAAAAVAPARRVVGHVTRARSSSVLGRQVAVGAARRGGRGPRGPLAARIALDHSTHAEGIALALPQRRGRAELLCGARLLLGRPLEGCGDEAPLDLRLELGARGQALEEDGGRRRLRWLAPRAPPLGDVAEGAHTELVGGVRAQAALGATRHADLLARGGARPLLLLLLAPLQVVGRGAAPHRRDPVDGDAEAILRRPDGRHRDGEARVLRIALGVAAQLLQHAPRLLQPAHPLALLLGVQLLHPLLARPAVLRHLLEQGVHLPRAVLVHGLLTLGPAPQQHLELGGAQLARRLPRLQLPAQRVHLAVHLAVGQIAQHLAHGVRLLSVELQQPHRVLQRLTRRGAVLHALVVALLPLLAAPVVLAQLQQLGRGLAVLALLQGQALLQLALRPHHRLQLRLEPAHALHGAGEVVVVCHRQAALLRRTHPLHPPRGAPCLPQQCGVARCLLLLGHEGRAEREGVGLGVGLHLSLASLLLLRLGQRLRLDARLALGVARLDG